MTYEITAFTQSGGGSGVGGVVIAGDPVELLGGQSEDAMSVLVTCPNSTDNADADSDGVADACESSFVPDTPGDGGQGDGDNDDTEPPGATADDDAQEDTAPPPPARGICGTGAASAVSLTLLAFLCLASISGRRSPRT
jgi:hypothetical protein